MQASNDEKTVRRMLATRLEVLDRHIIDLKKDIESLEEEYYSISQMLITCEYGEIYIPDGRTCTNCKKVKAPSKFNIKPDGSYTATCRECLNANKYSKSKGKRRTIMAEPKEDKKKPKRETLEEYMARLKKEGKSYSEIQKAETLYLMRNGEEK